LAIHAYFCPENVLVVKPYRGEENDRELSILSEFLLGIADKEDFRPITRTFSVFQNQKAERCFNQKDEVVRKIETKFMQSLRVLPQKKKPYSASGKIEYDFEDIDEDVQMTPLGVTHTPNSAKILKSTFQETLKAPLSCGIADSDKESQLKKSYQKFDFSLGSIEDKQSPTKTTPKTFANQLFGPKVSVLAYKARTSSTTMAIWEILDVLDQTIIT